MTLRNFFFFYFSDILTPFFHIKKMPFTEIPTDLVATGSVDKPKIYEVENNLSSVFFPFLFSCFIWVFIFLVCLSVRSALCATCKHTYVYMHICIYNIFSITYLVTLGEELDSILSSFV